MRGSSKVTWLALGLSLSLAGLSLLSGCPGSMEDQGDGGPPDKKKDANLDSTWVDMQFPEASADRGAPSGDAMFANDPPVEYCGPDEGWSPPPVPGGTPECPDDKNLEGCPCNTLNEQAACWPGLRANRNRGICVDGVTTCELHDEVSLQWGPCQGAILPDPNATLGAEACLCFSRGNWDIQNTSPCFVSYGGDELYAVSTYMDSAGTAHCPNIPVGSSPPPAPEPGYSWSENRLTVDCAGQFELCLTLKSGNKDQASATDCVLAETCVDVWYPDQGVAQSLPPLPAWSAPDSQCAKAFTESGGYGEMSVRGLSIECEPIDDGAGGRRVFGRFQYCPLACSQNPSLPGCENCGNGASGEF